jgi:hypothetical protein
MTFDVEILLWRSDLLRTVVSANSGQDASKKVGEAFSKTEGPMHTVTSLVLDDGQTVQVIHELTLADDIDVRSEEGFERGVEPGSTWDELINEVEAMFKKNSTNPMLSSTTAATFNTNAMPSVESPEAIEWLETALHSLADDVAEPAVEDATRLQGLLSAFCTGLRADEPSPEELHAKVRGIVEVLPRLKDRTCEILDRMDGIAKTVVRLG